MKYQTFIRQLYCGGSISVLASLTSLLYSTYTSMPYVFSSDFYRENAEDLRFVALKRKGFQLHPPRRQLYSVRVLQLVYIPGLGNEGTQAQRAGSGPKGRLLLDFGQHRSD